MVGGDTLSFSSLGECLGKVVEGKLNDSLNWFEFVWSDKSENILDEIKKIGIHSLRYVKFSFNNTH